DAAGGLRGRSQEISRWTRHTSIVLLLELETTELWQLRSLRPLVAQENQGKKKTTLQCMRYTVYYEGKENKRYFGASCAIRPSLCFSVVLVFSKDHSADSRKNKN
ncbi:hypothetical protein, partial [Modicisalibacter xianhensis]|uniref:hypothetical protein n=1 Tax=Modicisalibacter xianhensis TaxID=442341 RepID=UPI001AB0607A